MCALYHPLLEQEQVPVGLHEAYVESIFKSQSKDMQHFVETA